MHLKKWPMIGGAIAIALAIVWIIAKKQPNHQDDLAQVQQKEHPRPNRAKASSVTHSKKAHGSATLARRALVTPQTPATQEEVDQILVDLNKAAITYDAKELSKIDPYLLHSDPVVRKAAIDAMITLGDASAGPLLRQAAARAPSPHEAVALSDAADYVELPPAKLRFKKKTK